jgi:hypothetical protein
MYVMDFKQLSTPHISPQQHTALIPMRTHKPQAQHTCTQVPVSDSYYFVFVATVSVVLAEAAGRHQATSGYAAALLLGNLLFVG